MKKTYQVPARVWGELRLGRAVVPFEYEPGEHVPADVTEAAVLRHLEGIGAARTVSKSNARKGAVSHGPADRT